MNLLYLKQVKRLAIASFALILAGQGCLAGGGGTPKAKVDDNASAPKENSVSVVAGNCTHPYMLLRKGSSITYSTEVEGKAYSYVQNVKENNGKKAVLAYNFPKSGLNITQTLDCKADGIFAEGFLDFGSIISGTTVSTKTVSAEGSMLPADMKVGSEWSNRFEIVSTIKNPSIPEQEINQTMDISRSVVKEESVTVPAGTFNALVVDAEFKNNMKTQFGNFSSNSTQTEYWVKGIGLVKSVSTGKSKNIIEATEIVK